MEKALDIAPKGVSTRIGIPGYVAGYSGLGSSHSNPAVSFSDIESAREARNELKAMKPKDMDGDEYVKRICHSLRIALDTDEIHPVETSDSPFDLKMTWGQVAGLVEEGHIIVPKGFAHTRPYTELSKEDIQLDIRKGEKIIFENTGVSPIIAAHPEGKWNEKVIEVLEEEGYSAAFTMDKGVITKSDLINRTKAFTLPRYTVTNEMLALENQ